MVAAVCFGEEVTTFLLSRVCNMRKCCDGEINLYKYLYRFTHFQHPWTYDFDRFMFQRVSGSWRALYVYGCMDFVHI